eukprot:TRINITY_DN227_c0_g1_i2.p2 TRINITY_DN227_c0_g1~~TRINITY_DN227_c0_g1_i2.p2  ORF type:complete len:154 (-),score=27.44 TRINITY_DN227_c0_g1_i2:40-501(-)
MSLNLDGVEESVTSFKASTTANYIAFEIDGANVNQVGDGTNGLSGLVQLLDTKKIIVGLLKIFAVDNEGSHRTKFVFFSFIGSDVGPLKRAKVSVQKPEILKAVGSFACQFGASDPADFDMKSIAKELCRSSGAHKPAYYDFGCTKLDLSSLE